MLSMLTFFEKKALIHCRIAAFKKFRWNFQEISLATLCMFNFQMRNIKFVMLRSQRSLVVFIVLRGKDDDYFWRGNLATQKLLTREFFFFFFFSSSQVLLLVTVIESGCDKNRIGLLLSFILLCVAKHNPNAQFIHWK